MIDKRLSKVRGQLDAIDPSDKDALATAWKNAYRKMLTYTLHGMHELAWQHDIAAQTAADWIDAVDVTGIEPPDEPVLAIRKIVYVKGCEVGIIVEQLSKPTLPTSGEPWEYQVSVRSEGNEDVFSAQAGGFPSLDLAYRAGLEAARSAIGGIPVDSAGTSFRDD